MASRFLQPKLLAVIVGSLLIISIPLGFNLLKSTETVPNGIEVILSETIEFVGSIQSSMSISSSTFYKGDNLSLNLDLTVEESPITLYFISVLVVDSKSGRNASQSVSINLDYEIGQYQIPFVLQPGFAESGFVALTANNYTLSQYTLTYLQKHQVMRDSQDIGFVLNGMVKPVYEQMKAVNWTVNRQENATVTADTQNLSITPNQDNGTIFLSTTVQTTAYPRLYYNVSGIDNSTLTFGIAETNYDINVNNSEGYLSIGNVFDFQNFSIMADIRSREPLDITLSLPTQNVAVLTVVATNNWEGLADDNFIFRAPSYYIQQASDRFEQVLNLTLIPVAQVSFISDSGRDLIEMRTDALISVGKSLRLDSVGTVWTQGFGTQPENAGADILIVLTNRTMEYLGIVVGQNGERFNVAVHARGSFNNGQYRLPSVFADNLVQHEVSHIFGAPDRFTRDDSPSVMTKSQLEDAFRDIANGEFWLMRIDWLEIDIQEMVNRMFDYL